MITSAPLELTFETSCAPWLCLSLRASGIAERVFRAWIDERLAAWAQSWPVELLSGPARLVNGRWVAIVRLRTNDDQPSLEALLAWGLA